MSEQLPDRRVVLASAPNMRDLGGIPVAGGTVRTGVLYRSASLTNLDDADREAVVKLGITTVFDFRTAAERAGALDRLPADIRSIWLDVVADAPDNIAASIPALLADPAGLEEALGGGRAARYLTDANRDFVSMPSALAAYRQFYLDLIDDTRTGAALFHCTTGKDRTGWAAASFLLLLGASETDVRADYLQTNTDLAPALRPMLEALHTQGVRTELLQPILGVDDDYLDAALDELRTRYGTIEDYARNGLTLTDQQIITLRSRFIHHG
ncbi:tyrosine-protein phosphatase [Herbiconiux sp. CPCC 203407]|uniref:Tyrosine-protein phosphatase n=1 Tax=Herbiconiux oxytropis TaxID=2970915 RepID=A0AA41XCF1_9MICO|nr:tyrosine-protein phosphatase [Herbiconiux oxytropis]MCS5722039.1 tyrosine-protein phosphatase [Herbiconiux oxytropis]MCS5725622.1 tyrosine-protein phosphatase [Herbiconiux oxytropis]